MQQEKKIVILGAGESGVGAAMLARAKGITPFVSDSGKIKPGYKSTLLSNNILFEEGGHTEPLVLEANEVIKSPGIPENAPLIVKLKEKNIPVISEIEFASRYTHAKIIAITGTNGKTTTTYLTYHLMKEAGMNVSMAGNVGNSFAAEILKNNYDYYVLEISSFQLDGMFRFKPDIAVLMNITPDHLDRYDHDLNQYIFSKFRIIQNQAPADKFIYFQDDPVIMKYLDQHTVVPEKIPVSLTDNPGHGAYLQNDLLCMDGLPEGDLRLPLNKLPLKGPHNMVNIMSAVLAACCAGLEKSRVMPGLSSFVNFPHRMETVGIINNVTWVNDSKATNIDSARYALDSYNSPIIWIAGGIDKGNDYNLIRKLVRSKVKAIVCMGQDNSKIVESFKNDIEKIEDTHNLKMAVEKAARLAGPGDVVLLSPACASFDLFKNYIDRGDQFREAVKELFGKKVI